MRVQNPLRKRQRGRVTFLRRNRIVVSPPKEVQKPQDALIASIGAFADFPLWDEFLAEIEANRREQNQRIDDVL